MTTAIPAGLRFRYTDVGAQGRRKAVEFYRRAFGRGTLRHAGPDGKG